MDEIGSEFSLSPDFFVADIRGRHFKKFENSLCIVRFAISEKSCCIY